MLPERATTGFSLVSRAFKPRSGPHHPRPLDGQVRTHTVTWKYSGSFSRSVVRDIFIIVAVLALLPYAAARWGYDSRDGFNERRSHLL